MSERFFTVEKSDIKKDGGRFSSSTPYNAAAKAARSLFRQYKGAKTEIRFTLRETTQGSANKTYTYIGIKTVLNKPKVIVRGDKEILIEHEYSVKSCIM